MNKLGSDYKEFEDFLADMKTRLVIDLYDYSGECTRQPLLHQEAGEIFARIKKLAKQTKRDFESAQADLSIQIRSKPSLFGLPDKITERAIETTMLLQPEYSKAKDECIQCEYVVDCFSVLMNTIEQRKAMIRDLVSLYVHSYYTGQNLESERNGVKGVRREQIKDERKRRYEDRMKDDEESRK